MIVEMEENNESLNGNYSGCIFKKANNIRYISYDLELFKNNKSCLKIKCSMQLALPFKVLCRPETQAPDCIQQDTKHRTPPFQLTIATQGSLVAQRIKFPPIDRFPFGGSRAEMHKRHLKLSNA